MKEVHPKVRLLFSCWRANTVVSALMLLIASCIVSPWSIPLLAKQNQAFAAASWNIVPSPNVASGYNYLNKTAMVSITNVWAVGVVLTSSNNQTLVENWNGTQWNIISSPNPGLYSRLNDIAVVSASDIWAVGRTAPDNTFAHESTLAEHWNGTSWSVVPSPSVGQGDTLNGVAVVSANDIWPLGGRPLPTWRRGT
jgi:hypothetical protein